MNLRKIFIALTMGIIIVLPSATAFVPVSHADPNNPPVSPRYPLDCDDEYKAWEAAITIWQNLKHILDDIRSNEFDTRREEEYTGRKYKEVLDAPLRIDGEVVSYSPYANKAAWEAALNAKKAEWDAAVAAHNAAVKAEKAAVYVLRLAEIDMRNALNALLACINSH